MFNSTFQIIKSDNCSFKSEVIYIPLLQTYEIHNIGFTLLNDAFSVSFSINVLDNNKEIVCTRAQKSFTYKNNSQFVFTCTKPVIGDVIKIIQDTENGGICKPFFIYFENNFKKG